MIDNFSFNGQCWVVIDGTIHNYLPITPHCKLLDKKLAIMIQIHKIYI